MIRVDPDPLTGVGFGHPGELHQGATGGGEDQRLDLFRISIDPETLPADEGDLGDGRHGRLTDRRVRWRGPSAHGANSEIE